MTIYTTLAGLESSNRNVTSTLGTTSSGLASGYFQITPGTFQDFAPSNILAQYPATSEGILSAPYEVQQAVVSNIPVSRFAASTRAGLEQAGYDLTGNPTIGQLAAQDNNVVANGSDNPLSFTCENCGGTTGTTDNTNASTGGVAVDSFGNPIGNPGVDPNASTGGVDVGSVAPGLTSNFAPAILDAVSSGLMRVIMVIFGLVLIAAGAYVLANKDTLPAGMAV